MDDRSPRQDERGTQRNDADWEWDRLLLDLDPATSEVDRAGVATALDALLDPDSFTDIGSLATGGPMSYDPSDSLTIDSGGADGGGNTVGWGTVGNRAVFVVVDHDGAGDQLRGQVSTEKAQRIRHLAIDRAQPLVSFYSANHVGSDQFVGLGTEASVTARNLADHRAAAAAVPLVSIIAKPLTGTAGIEALAAHLVIVVGDEVSFTITGNTVTAHDLLEDGWIDQLAPDVPSAARIARDYLMRALPLQRPTESVAPTAEDHAHHGKTNDTARIADAIATPAQRMNIGGEPVPGTVAAVTRVDGRPVGLVAAQGVLDDCTSRRLARTILWCDRLHLPVVLVLGNSKLSTSDASLELLAAFASSRSAMIEVRGPETERSWLADPAIAIGPHGSDCDAEVADDQYADAVSAAIRRLQDTSRDSLAVGAHTEPRRR